MNYDDIIEYAKHNNYVLTDYHRKLLWSICNNECVILPRGFGRKYVIDLVRKFMEETK